MFESNKPSLALLAVSFFLVATAAIPAMQSRAQGAGMLQLAAEENNKEKKPIAKPAPRRAAPHVNVPRRAPPPHNVQRKAPAIAPKRVVRPPANGPKVVTPQSVGPKVIGPAAVSKSGVAPATRTFTPSGPRSRTVTAGALRGMPTSGAGRTYIHGRNYSVWRRGYRVRHGGAWWTFAALNTLGVIVIGGYDYYPYAYISAPEDYCDGLTPDGCQLVWQDVETDEGDTIPACVAYCPWQQ
jgi:hypothetical protein